MPYGPRVRKPAIASARLALAVLAALAAGDFERAGAHQLTPRPLPQLPGDVRLEPRLPPAAPDGTATPDGTPSPAHLRALGLTAPPPPEAGRGTVIALVDLGVDADHPALAGRLLPAVRLVVPSPGEPDSAGPASDRGEHGTALAGLLVAGPSEPMPVQGLAPGASVLPIQVGTDSAPPAAATVAAGIRAGCEQADVVLVGLAGFVASPELEDAVRSGVAAGCLIVAPAGNQGVHHLPAPAALEGVIAVAGLGSDGLLQEQTNLEAGSVAVAAPAEATTLASGDGRASIDGSSAAAALVAGSLAWMIGEHGDVDPVRARALLRDSARPLDDDGAQGLGFGVLDLPALIAAAGPDAPAAPAPVELRVAPLSPLPGQEIEVEVTVRNRGGSASAPAELTVAAGGETATAEVAPLAAGETATVALRLTAPVEGSAELTATLSGAGPGGAGPLSMPLILATAPEPRVVLTSTRLGSVPLAGGPPVDLTATVENWGNAVARGVEVVFQLDGAELARRQVPALAVGERREVRASWSPPAEGADRVGGLLVAAAAEGDELTGLGILVRDLLVSAPGTPLRPQYADKAGEPIEFVADAPHYSVTDVDYLPVLAFFPQIDLPRYRGERTAANPLRTLTPCEDATVTVGGVPYRIRRSAPQILGLSILDLNRVDRAFNASGPRNPTVPEIRRAIDQATVFSLSNRRRPVAVRDGGRDRPPAREAIDGVTAVDEQGRPVTDDDLAGRLLCPRETGHVVFRVPKRALLARTLFQIMPAGGVPAALAARRDLLHLQLGVELHLIPNPLESVFRPTQAQALAQSAPVVPMARRQVSYGPGRDPIRGHRRVRKQLLVQLGDALPLPPAGGGAGNLRADRYVDAHVHTIAEYVGLELELGKRPLAPFKAFGGPLQMLAESAVSIGLVPFSEVPLRDGRPDVRFDSLRHKVVTTDHNVFYSESEQPRYYGERTPPVLADLLAPRPGVPGTAPAPGPQTELELFRRTFGLALGEELTLRPFAPNGSDPAGRPPQDDPHGLSFLDLSFEGPWYGGKASFRRAVDVAGAVLDVDRAPDNPNTLRNVFAQARCARLPADRCLACCRALSGGEVVGEDSELRNLCASQACERGFRTGREPFLYAAHPFAGGFLWNRDGFELTDLASGTGASARTTDGRDRSLVTVDDDFLYKGAQFWNRRAPLSVARVDLPLRRLQAPYPVNGRLAGFLSAPDGLEPVRFAEPGDPGYADGWLLELLAGQQDWMNRSSEGLRFSFTGPNDPKDVRLIRKLYAAAGTDAHGDFNYQEDILSSATDLESVKRIVALRLVQQVAQPSGFDFAHQQLQASNAFGAVRTLLLTADKPVPEGIAAGAGERAEGASDQDKRAIQALADGNTVLTDGPAIDFSLDSDGRFDSAALSWHSGVNLHQNRDGRIGGEGRFDGGRSMLVVNGYAVLDESGGGGVPDELVPFPGVPGGLDDLFDPGTAIGVTGTVRPLQVLTPLVTPGLVRQTPTVALENRPGTGYPDVFYSFGWNNPDAFGGKPIAVHLYRGTPSHVPSLDQPTRRFTLGEIPPAGVVYPEWKVARFPSQLRLPRPGGVLELIDATDRISDLSYTYAEALAGRATPQTADHRAITNPVWSIPVNVRILLDKPLISAPEGLSATIPECGLRIEYNFPISMKAASYPVRIKQLDSEGDSLDDPADAIAATFLPLTPACQPAENFGWEPRAQPRNEDGVRHSKYIVRNDRPIPVAGPFFPRPENFPRDLPSSVDARRLLRSFVVYFASGTAPFGPLDFHDNPLNTVAALFSVELVPLAIAPPDGDPPPPDGDPLPPIEVLPLPLPEGPVIGPRPGGTIERPRGGIVLPNGIRLAPRPPAAGAPR